MASNNPDEKKIIFSGSYYEAWREYITTYFLTDDMLEDLIDEAPSPTELEFVAWQPDQYQDHHLNHRARQAKGKSIIYARVTLPILNSIRSCKTVRQIICKLDQEYRPQSAAAELLARKRFYGLRFHDGGDMEAYLRIFQDNADMLRDSGCRLDDQELIKQLMASLSANYDVAITNYNVYELRYGPSLQVLKRMIRDRYERDHEEKKLLSKYSSHFKTDKDVEKASISKKPNTAGFQSRQTRNSAPEKSGDQPMNEESMSKTTSESSKPFKCFQCGGTGHSQAECPSKPKKDTKQNSVYEEKKAQAHAMVVTTPSEKINANQSKENFFLLDSGAFRHMTANKTYLTNLQKLSTPVSISGAKKDAPLMGTHTGDLLIDVSNRFGTRKTLFLADVLYVPDLEIDLLSEEQITRTERYEVRFTHQFADVFDVEDQHIIFSAARQNGAKYVYYQPIADDRSSSKTNTAYPVTQANRGEVPEQNADIIPETQEIPETESSSKNGIKWLWHRRMGHMSGKYLRLLAPLVEGMPDDLNIQNDDFRNCEICIKARSTELGHGTVRRKPERKFDIVATDIMGPFIAGPAGEKFVVTFIDLFTNFVTIDIIKRKGDAAGSFARYHKRAEAKFPGQPLRILRADCAKEFQEGECKAYCDATGITVEQTSPYAPQLNGAAERMNRTLTERLRALLFDSELDLKFWPRALETAAYLVNRSPTRTNPDHRTPFELWHGYKPDLKNIRVFGSLAFRHVPEEVRHQMVTSQRRKDSVSPTAPIEPQPLETSLTTPTVETTIELPLYSPPIIPPALSDDGELPQPVSAEPIVVNDHTYAWALACNKQFRPKRLLEECVPTSYAGIKGNPFENDWRRAVKTEFDALQANNVFTVVKKIAGSHPIDTKWVFDIKYSPTGEPIAKARLVARGFRETEKYTISETYSPVVNNWLIRWAFSLANRGDMEIVQYDVSTAFLHADIARTVCLTVPDGMNLESKGQVLQLQKSLYGLKSSSKNWYNLLDSTIRGLNFERTKADRCLYFRRLPNNKIALLLAYVDDLLLLTDYPAIIDEVSKGLAASFKLKINTNPTCFVGYEIRRDREKRCIYLSQKSYTNRILQRFSMADCYAQNTPMDSNLKIAKPSEGTDDTEYRAMIGALGFLARNTRPDIAFAVNALSRIQNCSTDTEKNYVRRIFRYLRGTSNFALCFTSTGSKLEAFVDASYAPDATEENPTVDVNFGRSVSGYLVRLFGDPVMWAVKKQSIVAPSSTAAELVAVHDALDDVRVARFIMLEIFDVADPVIIHEDNTSTLRILMGGEQKKVRSILIKCYDTMEAVAAKEISLQPVTSANQLADLLTKPLEKEKFHRLKNQILYPLPEI